MPTKGCWDKLVLSIFHRTKRNLITVIHYPSTVKGVLQCSGIQCGCYLLWLEFSSLNIQFSVTLRKSLKITIVLVSVKIIEKNKLMDFISF